MKSSMIIASVSFAKNINVNDIKRRFKDNSHPRARIIQDFDHKNSILNSGNLLGNFFENFDNTDRTYFYGNENSIRGLASMATFLQNGQNQRNFGGNSMEEFDLSVSEFIEKFTNYGCYCWILGAERGVIGGGQTRDQIDGLCGQLYKCYKCLNLDYGNDQSKFVYDVSLVVGDDGNRHLECHEGKLFF